MILTRKNQRNKKQGPSTVDWSRGSGPEAVNMLRRYYTMKINSRKAVILLAAVIALAVIGTRALDDYLNRTAWERAADIVYPMTNRGIEWTYAGKDGAGR